VATIEFIAGIEEEVSEIKLRRGRTSGNRIVVFIFTEVKAMGGLRSFSAGSMKCMRLVDEEGDIEVYPRGTEFFYKNDDDLARLEFTFELVNEEQWTRVQRFMERYAERNGMGYQDRGKS